MNGNQDEQKKRKIKTPEELIKDYEEKIDKLKKKQKAVFNKKLRDSFAFLFDHPEILEEIREFKGNKDFESKFITFIEDVQVKKDKE